VANSKDNISKYATSFIGFDELGGNTYDNIGGYMGTIYNNPTRVEGWNGQGYAISFNGTNQYIQFNSQVFKIGNKTIRFKIRTTDTIGNLLSVGRSKSGNTNYRNGLAIALSEGKLRISTYVNSDSVTSNVVTVDNINDNQWHDIIIFVEDEVASIYVDGALNATGSLIEPTTYSDVVVGNLVIGRLNVSGFENYFSGQLDSIEIYDRIISPTLDKYFVFHNNEFKYHDGTSWKITSATEENFIQYGMEQLSEISEAQWQELSGDISIVMWSDFEDKQSMNVVLERDPFTAKDIIGDEYDIIILDNDANIQQLELTAHPSNQELISVQDILLLGVARVDTIILNGVGGGKVGFSVDGGNTYKALREGQWITISNMSEGNTFEEVNNLNSSQVALLRGNSNTLRMSYWIADDTVIEDVKIIASMEGVEKFASTSNYDVEYDMANKKIIYTIKVAGKYGFTYTDSN